MNVSVFGLGYVGTVMAACLAEYGHEVYGVDVNPRKVEAINAGEPPINEPGVAERIETGVAERRLRATKDPTEAIANSSISMITVGTPLDDTGQLSSTNLYNVIDSTEQAIDAKSSHTIVVRSTVPPGVTRNLRSYLDNETDESTDVAFLVNPEFLREGTAVEDFYHPPYTVIGAFVDGRVKPLVDLYRSMDIQADTHVVDPEVAEALKMVNNAFHALKICFANEVGSLAANVGIDGKELLQMVCEDSKLNISEKYLEPGFAFGGGCLPKDTQAIATIGSEEAVSTPLLDTILRSNDQHLDRIHEVVAGVDPGTVGILGLSFKPNTVDLRNSPGIRLAKQFETDTLLYAEGIDISEIIGANRDYLARTLPDFESRMVKDAEAFAEGVDTVVVTNDGDYDDLVPLLQSKTICDPVGGMRSFEEEFDEYHTISW